MVPDEDLYRILEVLPSADAAAIRASYRRLARRYHPDARHAAFPGGHEVPEAEAVRRMREINRAWEVLGDPARRAVYDGRRAAASGSLSPTRGPTAARAEPTGRRAARPAPVGRSDGTVLSFGRYAGWTLTEVARRDPDYLEWLDRSPTGRPHRDEIDALLRRVGRRTTSSGPQTRTARFRA